MISDLEKCEQQAQRLPIQERAVLIQHLIEGLDELDELEFEQLWIKEASRRFEEYKTGNIETRSGSQVFSNIRTKLQELR
jgi:putative addiction module component (TIGR02574 family)